VRTNLATLESTADPVTLWFSKSDFWTFETEVGFENADTLSISCLTEK
jgi:hypothetical protein